MSAAACIIQGFLQAERLEAARRRAIHRWKQPAGQLLPLLMSGSQQIVGLEAGACAVVLMDHVSPDISMLQTKCWPGCL